MLRRIRIQRLGVIEDAALELAPGLNVITGETGAGKTMLVSGLGLLFGARADTAAIRAGAADAVVEGEIDLDGGHPALVRAQATGADVDDGLILVRSLSEHGRSRAHIGGRAAPIGVLTELAQHLIAVHGQADQWRLRQPEQHRELLDAAAGEAHRELLDRYRAAFGTWRRLRDHLAELTADRVERSRQAEMLRAALEEIEEAAPQPGEDVALAEEEQRLGHADELLRAAATAAAALVGADETGPGQANALGLLADAARALREAATHDGELAELTSRLDELSHLMVDLGSDLGRYAAGIDLDPARLAHVQQRRADLSRLVRKYGSSIDDVLDWAGTSAAELAMLDTSQEHLDELQRQLDAAQVECADLATALHQSRVAAAATLSQAVSAELAHLAMGSAAIEVAVTATDPGPHGADQVEIRLAANPGAPARTVTKAASGGELSRVMLALELVSANGGVPTFVFDEVDAGVGGSAALDLGARLARVADHSQVIVVTHLAQVAAFADQHLVVRKSTTGAVTSSDVVAVRGQERITEIARMLSGVSDSAAAREHAEELLTDHARS